MTIKELREASGMTQKAFAEYVGVNKSTIEKWEYSKPKCPEYIRTLIEYKLKGEDIMLNNYAEQVADFTEEAIEGFTEPQRIEAFNYYESYVNDYAHGLNDSRSWNLSSSDLTTVIGKACVLVKQYIEE